MFATLLSEPDLAHVLFNAGKRAVSYRCMEMMEWERRSNHAAPPLSKPIDAASWEALEHYKSALWFEHHFPPIFLRAQSMALAQRLPILLLVAMMIANTSASKDRASFYVTKCYPPPTSTAQGRGAFRGNLVYLLEALPSAAAPTGFASLQTAGGAVTDRALVRGLCFGDSAPKPCRRCLSRAGKKITKRCGGSSQRAGFLDDRCFLVYTNGGNGSSAGADGDIDAVILFSGDAVQSPDIVSGQMLVALAQSLAPLAAKGSVATVDATTPASKGDATAGNRTVRVLAQCATDRTAADCVSCLRDASLSMAKSWESSAVEGRVAAVLGSSCYLRFKISTPQLPMREKIRRMLKDNLVLTVCVAVIIVLVVGAVIVFVCVWAIKDRNNRNAALEAMSAADDDD